MIKIKKTDNIYDIIYKIEKNKNNKKIVLEIPFGHQVLYNYLSLKSIKNKFQDKKIIITTTDIASKKIGKALGIKYSIIKDKNFIEENKDLLKYNYTFLEYFRYELKKYYFKIYNYFFKNKKYTNSNKFYSKYYKQKSGISLFLILLSITLSIFFYIFYFALNKTNVYITPAIKVQTKSQNSIFVEKPSNQILGDTEEKLLKIEKTITLEEIFKTTGIKQDDKFRASGKVELINNFTEEIKLRPSTRLLSSNGILYETNSWVTIPGAKKNSIGELIPGITEVTIKSKLKDDKGIFIGERGNLSKTGSILTVPGLAGTGIDIYAKTITPLDGGENKSTKIVAEDDKQKALELFTEKLKKQAIKEINNELNKKNETNNITYKILGIDDIYSFSNIDVNFSNELKHGTELDSFKVIGKIDAYTFAYNIDSIISKLKKEIEASIIPEKEKILFINDKSIRISNIIYREEKPFNLKATVEIEVFISYNFENEDDNYVQRLKQTISGMNKDEAEKTLINESKISNVKIDIRPFFLKNISSFYNNIRFFIEK